jgi:ferredoxin--NADP+ reductase
MVKVLKKEELNSTTTRMVFDAPLIAAKALPGQFVILRVDDEGERIPLTVNAYDRAKGTLTLIFQIAGATTERLNHKKEGENIAGIVGPLGNPTKISGKKVCVVGGGLGVAIAYPVAQAFHDAGIETHGVMGFRNKDLIILREEFEGACSNYIMMTDDGSFGMQGLVTVGLQKLIDEGNKYDEVMIIGPMIMMKFVTELCKKNSIPCTVSMNQIMIDGTGMCGGCRLTVDDETRFACVDGPDFDGWKVDFDEALARGGTYRPWELKQREAVCNLFEMAVAGVK